MEQLVRHMREIGGLGSVTASRSGGCGRLALRDMGMDRVVSGTELGFSILGEYMSDVSASCCC